MFVGITAWRLRLSDHASGSSAAAAETCSVRGCCHAVLMAGCYTLWSRGRRIIRIGMTVEAVGSNDTKHFHHA